MYKRISARMHFILITKWNEIKKRENTRPFTIGSPRGRPVGETDIFIARYSLRCAFISHPFCPPLSNALSLTYEGYAKSLSRWNSKGRTPTLGFYLVSGAVRRGRPSPDGGTGDETKRGTNARTHIARSVQRSLDTKRSGICALSYRILSPTCCKKDLERVN